MEKKEITIFTDGSSLGNPGPGGFAAIVTYNPQPTTGNKNAEVTELGGREKKTTNNRMEMTAAIEALAFIANLQLTTYNLQLYTDSSYLLNGITIWVHGWQKNGWKTKDKKEVLNKDLWEKLLNLVLEIKEHGKIEWKLVKGHVGIAGNERCDLIATSFAEGTAFQLFKGSLADYEKLLGESVSNIESVISHVHPKKSHKQVFSYLSLVGGVLEKHKTWAECEKRVKGVADVKFRKAISKEDEEVIIKEWATSN